MIFNERKGSLYALSSNSTKVDNIFYPSEIEKLTPVEHCVQRNHLTFYSKIAGLVPIFKTITMK